MDWENESYVRLYVRDTTTWRHLGWAGQCVLMQLLRRVDRSGRLALGEDAEAEHWESIALHTGAPEDVARAGLAVLLKWKVATMEPGNVLFLPSFVTAQTARKSDRLRQRESRSTRDSGGRRVTGRDERSPGVTSHHDSAGPVTDGHDSERESHPSRSVTLSLAQPSSAQLSSAQPTKERGNVGTASVPSDVDAPPGFSEASPLERSRRIVADVMGLGLAVGQAADELDTVAPALTHTHAKQAAERVAEFAARRGLSRPVVALEVARAALRKVQADGNPEQFGFVLVAIDPWNAEHSRPRGGRIAPAPGTTAKDFEGVESFEAQLERIGKPVGHD